MVADHAAEAMTERLEEAFKLALGDLNEAHAAAQICMCFHDKVEQLAGVSVEHQQVWGFFEQGVIWKLALAFARLTQPANKDRASLCGLIREINTARENGARFADECRIREAQEELKAALAADICASLRDSRNNFIGHTLIDKDRHGVRVVDLIDYLGTLENIAVGLQEGVFGNPHDFDRHIDMWRQRSSTWFEIVLPDAS
jgi:hypothetical protein